MALGIFANGPYTLTWDGTEIGLCDTPKVVQRTMEQQDVIADQYGASVIDGIYRGGNVFIVVTVKEWTSTIQSLMWPFGATLGAMGQIGRLNTDLAKQMVLAPEPFTPAATNDNVARTFPLCLLAGGHNVEVPLGSVVRDMPILFRVYPSGAAPNTVWWTEA